MDCNALLNGKYFLAIPIDTDVVIGDREKVRITFEGVSFVWCNGTSTHFPEIRIPLESGGPCNPPYDWDSGPELSLVNRFLSRFCARFHRKLKIHRWHRYQLHDPSHPLIAQRYPGGMFGGVISEDWLSCPLSEREELALALYREGTSSESVFYAFLNYYKIVELAFSSSPVSEKSRKVIHFIDQHLEPAKKEWTPVISPRVNKDRPDGAGLFRAYRCSIAHASESQVRNPDDYRDYAEVWGSLETMCSLAVYVINHDLLSDKK